MISFALPGFDKLFGKPKPPEPVKLPPLPTPQSVGESDAEKRRKEEERLSRKRRSGLGATRLTSGLGDDDTAVSRSTLGGA